MSKKLKFMAMMLTCILLSISQVWGEATISVSSEIILPKGSTSVSTGDWISAAGVTKDGSSWAYTDWAGDQTIGSYGSINFSNAGDLNNADLLQFQKQGGYVQTTITSTAGVDIVIGYKVGGNSFMVSLTGADDVTGSSTSWSTMSISTTSTSATFKIYKNTKNAGYVSYIRITPKAGSIKTLHFPSHKSGHSFLPNLSFSLCQCSSCNFFKCLTVALFFHCILYFILFTIYNVRLHAQKTATPFNSGITVL